nr:hypothetical protein GCM10010200_056270 [Actinomadura rugatobispora]
MPAEQVHHTAQIYLKRLFHPAVPSPARAIRTHSAPARATAADRPVSLVAAADRHAPVCPEMPRAPDRAAAAARSGARQRRTPAQVR